MPTFSCLVVGEGAIALKCLEILQQSGHDVLGVYSAQASLQTWAAEHGIVHAASRRAFCDFLFSVEYDYLFSVNNGWIIPPEVIAHARQATINYHDSPLPKYAGLHATSWTLLHGETHHAITWHEVVAEIDAGRILKQPIVPIQADDTAFSLNTRCFEVAIDAFGELISELAENRVEGVAQDLSQRSYFGLDDRPEAAGVLNFDISTKSIGNLVRALDFGPIRNPLGLPKLWLPKGVVAVGATCPIPVNYGVPGQVLALDTALNSEGHAAPSICVATIDGAIQLSRITTLDGTPLSQDELSQQYGVYIGALLPMLSSSQRRAISEQNAQICRYEREWVRQLSQLCPFIHPYLHSSNRTLSGEDHRYALSLARNAAPSCPLDAEALLALFAAYCARLATESTIYISIQTDAQRSVASEIFAQVVPVRIDAEAKEPLSQFCERFRAALSQAVKQGTYAIDVSARHPELRGTSSPNALPVAIVLAASPTDLEFHSLNASMALVAYTDGSVAELVHRGALSEIHSHAIVQQLQCLIAASIDHPEQPVSTLPLLSSEEQQQILIDWNRTAQPYPRDRCIHELITEQARQTPDAIAVCFGEDQLSYQDLDRRSNQLAHRLHQLGVRAESLVALCVPRSVELIVGLLGILKAGGAYVPIDPTYPGDRIAYLIDDSCPQAVVTVAALQATVFGQIENLVCLDEQAATLAQMSADPLITDVTPENLAYVIYTSGSTGKPKGVEIRHRSVVNHGWAIANLYQLHSSDRMLQSASISFDVAGEQIYPVLFRGAAVIVRPDDLMESFDQFSQFVEAQAITVMILPTAFWHEWTVELLACNQKVPPRLRVLCVGTEKALGNRLAQWQTVSEGRVAFFQGYGPTEATVTCTMYCHDGRSLEAQEVLPIGYPLPNTEIYILDRHLQPVPVGVVGELYVGGEGLARGYHHQPSLTAQRFIPHPFSTADNARLYQTGDLARFEPDGQIVYCDRSDDQIKLNGFRIELGEIEAVFNEHLQVKQAVVHPYQTEAGLRRLVAYVVPHQAHQDHALIEELNQFVRQTLPSYMVPSAIVVLDSLPRTPNGKVDRRALPKPNLTGKRTTSSGVPCNPLEQQLADIWQTVLGIDAIHVTDNFFELGGHSLMAIRLLQQIEQVCHQKISLTSFLQAPTIEQLAIYLQQQTGEGLGLPNSFGEGVVPIQPCGSKPPLFGIHVLGKGLSFYRPLAKRLGTDQPLYGLAAQLTDEAAASNFRCTEEIAIDVEGLAAYYIRSLQTVQPEGPYHLVGVSFGGLVAFEMARQLRAQGQDVALLGMLDTGAPIDQAAMQLPFSARISAYWTRLVQLQPTETIAKLKHQLAGRSLKYPVCEAAYRWFYRVIDRPFPDALQEILYIQQSQNAASRYTPRLYPGRITLFQAKDQVVSAAVTTDPRLGWRELAEEGLQVHAIPGDHLGMMQEPHVQVLAEQLKPYLNP
jgi:amino acid adenylation domain-containing protein